VRNEGDVAVIKMRRPTHKSAGRRIFGTVTINQFYQDEMNAHHIDDERQQYLLAHQGVYILTYKRANQHTPNTPLEKWLLDKYRQRIETTASQLAIILERFIARGLLVGAVKG
jgi:hypothetical protein